MFLAKILQKSRLTETKYIKCILFLICQQFCSSTHPPEHHKAAGLLRLPRLELRSVLSYPSHFQLSRPSSFLLRKRSWQHWTGVQCEKSDELLVGSVSVTPTTQLWSFYCFLAWVGENDTDVTALGRRAIGNQPYFQQLQKNAVLDIWQCFFFFWVGGGGTAGCSTADGVAGSNPTPSILSRCVLEQDS